MDYQLVLQFKGNDLLDFDALVSFEDELQELIEPIADVDGHDMGSGEANIFVLTADPVATIERAKALLSKAALLDKVRVAYREVLSDVFTIVWPERSTEAFVVA
ncbi:MAG: ABC transporter [Gammaproteobacteria bacterium]